MNGCVLGSQYIPSIEYFAHWMHYGAAMMEFHEHYQKRTWRNKTAILGVEKSLTLTVPLRKGKHDHMKITDILISNDEPWHKIHLNGIKTAYGKTAFFDEVIPLVENIYHSIPETLWDLNLNLIEIITSMIPGEWRIEMTEDYHPVYPFPVNDLRSGVPAGKSQLQNETFPTYQQVQRIHKPHQPNLCILDALCHLGPETSGYLARYAAKLYEKS